MIIALTIASAIVAYLIGSINSSILISRAISGKDIRESGSGNAGATNMLRTHGKKMGILTLLIDVLKGIVAVLLANIVMDKIGYIEWLPTNYIAAVGVMLGHNYPVFFGFKGGKGVATSLGAVYMLNWHFGIILTVCGIGVMALTRYVSFGSILSGIAFIAGDIVNMLMTGTFGIVRCICSILLGGMLVFRHKDNIKRLIDGTESKLGEKK